MFLAPTSDTTGASGAWVRDTNGRAITRHMAGVKDSTASSYLTQLQEFNDVVFQHHEIDADFSCESAISGQLFIGPPPFRSCSKGR